MTSKPDKASVDDPTAAGDPKALVVAPVEVNGIDCQGCALGRARHFNIVEFCPLITRSHPTGALIATAGEKADTVWLVKSGAVAGTWGRGREVDLMHPPGAFVGLEALHADTRVTTSWTLARTDLCSISIDAFRRWLDEHGEARSPLLNLGAEILAKAKPSSA